MGFPQHQGQEALKNWDTHNLGSPCGTSHVGQPELHRSSPGPPMQSQYQPVPEDRGSRPRRLPARFRDQLPEPPVSTDVPPTTASMVRCVFLHVFNSFRTGLNSFGIAREYRHRPTHDPDQFVSQGDLAFRPPLAASPADRAPSWPWANMTIWWLMTWAMTGSRQKSATEVT